MKWVEVIAHWARRLQEESARAAQRDMERLCVYKSLDTPIVCYEGPSFRLDDDGERVDRLASVVTNGFWYWFSSSWAARDKGAETQSWPPDTAPAFRECRDHFGEFSGDLRLWVEHAGWWIGKRVWLVCLERPPVGLVAGYREWTAALKMFERGESPSIHLVLQELEDDPRMHVFVDSRVKASVEAARTLLAPSPIQHIEQNIYERPYTSLNLASLKYISTWIGNGD